MPQIKRCCGSCRYFIGWGDWGLCCTIKEDLCYADTPACEDYTEKEE